MGGSQGFNREGIQDASVCMLGNGAVEDTKVDTLDKEMQDCNKSNALTRDSNGALQRPGTVASLCPAIAHSLVSGGAAKIDTRMMHQDTLSITRSLNRSSKTDTFPPCRID